MRSFRLSWPAASAKSSSIVESRTGTSWGRGSVVYTTCELMNSSLRSRRIACCCWEVPVGKLGSVTARFATAPPPCNGASSDPLAVEKGKYGESGMLAMSVVEVEGW